MRVLRLSAFLLFLWIPVAMATAPFTWAPGTNGFTTTPFSMFTGTELNGLTSGSTATSTTGCTSGKCSQTNTGNAVFANVWFVSGGAFTPVSTQTIGCWFIRSSDGGTTFELNPTARSPDFLIPLANVAFATNNLAFAQGGLVRLPAESWKLECQNNAGAGGTATTLPSSGNSIVIGPLEIQY